MNPLIEHQDLKRFNRVLLVDDDPIVNYLNRLVLEELDLAGEIIVHENAQDALEYIRTHCSGNTG